METYIAENVTSTPIVPESIDTEKNLRENGDKTKIYVVLENGHLYKYGDLSKIIPKDEI
jgi:hypothetical protein